jgi:TolB-like protein/lipoprotein NlpI
MDPPPEVEGSSIWARLRRRKVVQWGIAYAAGAWGFLQGFGYVSDLFDWPRLLPRFVALALLVGLPITVVVAWYHGDRGEQRVSRAELAILTLLFLLGGGLFWRYQHAGEPAPVEPAPSNTSAAAEPRSIAVLPFVNLSADKEQEYFADGIAEELLNLLTQVPQLRVTSRASAFSFKGQNIGVPEIAKRLSVAHVLEGSVRKSVNRVRVTAQLIDVRSDTQLWSQTWDRQLDDIFAVQDEIAAAVVAQLKVKLLGEVPKARPVDPQAYTLYLQALQWANRLSADGYQRAEALYKQALAIEPDYPAALAGLAMNYNRQVGAGLLAEGTGYDLAREATDRAIAIDPHYAPAYAVAGSLDIGQSNDLARAARDIGRAAELEPTSPFVLGRAAPLMYHLGRLDQAIALGEYQVARDPLDPTGHNNQGVRYLTAGRFDDAIASFQAVLRLSPDALWAHGSIGEALLLQGKAQAAIEAAQKEHDEIERLIVLAMAQHALRNRAESDRTLASLIAKHARDAPVNIALVMAYRGEADRAFEWLDRAAEYRDPFLTEAVFLPYFASIRSDPRWLPFLRRIGRAPEQLAAIEFEVKVPE